MRWNSESRSVGSSRAGDRADARHERHRVALRVDQHLRREAAPRRRRPVEPDAARGLRRADHAELLHDAHDLVPGQRVGARTVGQGAAVGDPHPPPDRVAPLQHRVDEALVHDRHLRPGGEVGGLESPPREDRRLEHLEVRRIHVRDLRGAPRPRPRRSARRGERRGDRRRVVQGDAVVHVVRARQLVHEADPGHPGLGRDAVAQRLDQHAELRAVGRGSRRVAVHVRAGRRVHAELHREVLVGREPDVVRPHPLHLPHLHQDDRGEGDGDGDLRDDHRRPHAAELQAAAAGRAGPQARARCRA
jgi:hypothetical protein